VQVYVYVPVNSTYILSCVWACVKSSRKPCKACLMSLHFSFPWTTRKRPTAPPEFVLAYLAAISCGSFVQNFIRSSRLSLRCSCHPLVFIFEENSVLFITNQFWALLSQKRSWALFIINQIWSIAAHMAATRSICVQSSAGFIKNDSDWSVREFALLTAVLRWHHARIN